MNKQYELGVMSSVKADVLDVPWDLVALCATKPDAYRLTMNYSKVKRSDCNWADLLGLTKGHLSQILNSRPEARKYMPPECEVELMRLAGNRAICQWLELAAKGQLRHQSSNREQELLDELAQIRANA